MKKSLMFLATMVLCACSGGTDDGPQVGPPTGAFLSKNYVQLYILPEKISGSFVLDDRYIMTHFSGREVYNNNKYTKEIFDELSRKYDDLTYNQKLVPYSNKALGKEYSGIDVVCDRDIDAAHKAGTSLDDMVKICALSHRDYVRSKYDPSFEPPKAPAEFTALSFNWGTPVFKLLSELEAEDMVLIEPDMYLYFTKKLDPGKYEFSITYKSAEGDDSFTVVVEVK